MASSRNLSTYPCKNNSTSRRERGYESIATRDWGPPGLRAGAGRGSISMQPRAEKVRRVRYLQIWPPSRSAEEEAMRAQMEALNTGT